MRFHQSNEHNRITEWLRVINLKWNKVCQKLDYLNCVITNDDNFNHNNNICTIIDKQVPLFNDKQDSCLCSVLAMTNINGGIRALMG